jgi:histone H3/H4
MADMIISKSKTKETVKECNVSGEFYSALDAKARKMIAAAEDRAKENGRKTVRPYDL